ncbi:homoserine kinase [bacterium]|jgi:homoserine kinase|nr:homoserine kinase [bacterium]
MSESVVVKIPASTSNCGAGFDTLGMALGLYGSVRVTLRDDDKVTYSGQITEFPQAAIDMVSEVGQRFASRIGKAATGFDFDIVSEVPIARGLGSSVILRGGVLAGLNHFAGSPLSKDDQVALISDIEGHPDNASAAILGGFTVARYCPESKQYMGTQKFDVSDAIDFVVVSPDLEIKTDDSRTTLPTEIAFPKVVSSLNSLSYLVAAFASGNYAALSASRVDHIHEPYRLPNIPHASESIQAGIDAGAYTGWLSGSGSSLLCVTDASKSSEVRHAMEGAFEGKELTFSTRVLKACNQGVSIQG